MKNSVFFKIFTGFLIVSIFPLIIGSYILYNYFIIEKRTQLLHILQNQLESKKELLLFNIFNEEKKIKNIIKIFLNKNRINDGLKFLIFQDKSIKEIYVFNNKGKFITGQSYLKYIFPDEKINLPQKKYSLFYKDNDYYLNIKIDINDKIFLIRISFRELLKKVFNKSEKTYYEYFIINNKGFFIYHTNFIYALKNYRINFLLNNLFLIQFINPLFHKKEIYFCFITKLDFLNLNFGISLKKSIALTGIYSFLYKGIFLISTIFLLSIIISFYITKLITSPIKELEKISTKIRKGNFDIKFPENKPNDEIGAFYSSFELMTRTLTQLINEKENQLKKLNLLYNTIDDSIYTIDDDYNITMINKNELQYIGDELQNVIGKKCYTILAKKSEKCPNCPIDSIKKSNSPVFFNNIDIAEKGFREKCKRKFVNIKFFPFGDNEFLVYIQDLTTIYTILNQIRYEKEKLYVTIQSIGDGVIVIDKNYKIVIINESAKKLFEINTNIEGKEIDKIVPEFAKYLAKLKINLKKINIQETKINVNNKLKIIEDSISPIIVKENLEGFVIVVRDITEKKKYEEEILKKEKLEAVGMLAAGIAHDFNNILTAALGNISLCELYLDNKEKLFDKLKATENSLYKAKSLTEKLLTFSKGGYLIKERNDIKKIIKESVDFILSGKDIRVKYNFGENLWSVNIDSSQITQVFHNLAINAIEAIESKGEIEITVKNKIIDDYSDIPLKKGNYIEIIFKDNGKGIPQEIINKIFDPFFTTKEAGSGLGLSTVYNIIKKHDGYIKVNSLYGKGTIFFIYLPAEKVDFNTDEKGKTFENNKEKKYNILLMDDNDELRNVVSELLQLLGHKVYTAINGEEAIKIYKNNHIDFVILDLTIPGGMGGRETLNELKKIDKNVKAIVSSGYTDDDVMANYKKYGFIAKIEKPYTLEKLKALLKELENF